MTVTTEYETNGRPSIANISRTSDVAHADYIYTLAEHAPDELKNLVSAKTSKAALKAIEEAGELFTSTTETTDLPISKSTFLSWSPHTSAPACTPARSALTETSVFAGQYSFVRYWTFVSDTQFQAPSTSFEEVTFRAPCTSARRDSSTGAVNVTRIGMPTPTVAPSRGEIRARNSSAEFIVSIVRVSVADRVGSEPVIVAWTS